MAHRAQAGWPEAGQFFQTSAGQDFAGPQIALAAEVEVLQLVADAFQGGHRLEHLHASAATSGPVPSPPMTATLRISLLLIIGYPRLFEETPILISRTTRQEAELVRSCKFLTSWKQNWLDDTGHPPQLDAVVDEVWMEPKPQFVREAILGEFPADLLQRHS